MTRLLPHPETFAGGVELEPNKAQSLTLPVVPVALPEILVIPLHQHIGESAELDVKVGDRVDKGQCLACPHGYISAAVHAPSSGVVLDIGEYPVPHPSGLKAPCIRIRTDGEERWRERHPEVDPFSLSPVKTRQRVREAGIVGLGGAGFPTSVKMNPGPDFKVHLLVINAVECEPYISCDEALIRCCPDDVISGALIIQHAVRAAACVIGIEDNMPEAADALQQSVERLAPGRIRVVRVPTRYPAGGEKQLIYALTGVEVPSDGLPIDVGVICQNVATAVAVYRAVRHDEPLVSRIVTVTGGGVATPRNLEVLIGTPMSALIEHCGGYTAEVDRLLMGGPMMGFALASDDLPVIKTTNCLLASTHAETPPAPPALPCIRCGRCAEVCPAGLLPQQLYWHSHVRNFEKTQDYNLFDCIECGCCALVCPSHIPLVQYYRFAKTEIRDQELQRRKSDIARRRHEFREFRLEREKRELAARRAQHKPRREKAGDADAKKAEIQAALERVKAKKAKQNERRN
jgi:electron transport complex protein RnfC